MLSYHFNYNWTTFTAHRVSLLGPDIPRHHKVSSLCWYRCPHWSLHCTTLYTTLRYLALHYTTLHYTSLHYPRVCTTLTRKRSTMSARYQSTPNIRFLGQSGYLSFTAGNRNVSCSWDKIRWKKILTYKFNRRPEIPSHYFFLDLVGFKLRPIMQYFWTPNPYK